MLSSTNIYLIGVLISVVVYCLIGIYAGRNVKNIEDFYVSGRNATTFFIASTMFASMLSTNGFMGDTGYCYSGNITTIMLINSICACGYILGPLFFGRYIRRAKVNTMPEYFGKRFNSIRIRKFAGIITIVSLSAYFLSVMQATGVLMESLTGYDRFTCLLISLACILFFTTYSGSRGVIITDTLMLCLFLIATIVAGGYIFKEAGGISNLVENLLSNPLSPKDLLSYHGNTNGESIFETVLYGVTMGIVWMIVVGVSPWQAGRNLMAKSEHVIFRSGSIAAILTIVFLLYLYIMAISVLQLNSRLENPEKVIIWTAFNILPKFIGMLLLTGIMAAGLSSASTFLSVISFSLTKDTLHVNFKSEKQELTFTRIIVFVVGILGLILAYFNISSIRIIAWFASTIIAASWGYVAFGSIWSKNLSERGAYYSMVGGFYMYIACKIFKELFGIPLNGVLDPFFIALCIGIALGKVYSKNQIKSSQEEDFYKILHIIPKSELNINDYKIDKIYAYILGFIGVLIAVFLIFFWAIPYNGFIDK